jgi:hypothetical protein
MALITPAELSSILELDKDELERASDEAIFERGLKARNVSSPVAFRALFGPEPGRDNLADV